MTRVHSVHISAAKLFSRSSRVRETMRAKRVKQEVDVGEERRPPPRTRQREKREGEEEARDPISMFARHYPRHCSSSRIRPESRSGRRSFVSPSPPILSSARDSSIPIRDLWIIVRLIPPAPSRNENLSRKTKIRFDSMMYRRRRCRRRHRHLKLIC